MPRLTPAQQPHHALLGQILATVLIAAIDAGAVGLNPAAVVSNPAELAGIIQGFVGIWAPAAMPAAVTVPAPAAAPPLLGKQ